ncbi:MAG: hypothetical protein PHS60_16320 [Zavarzinia sp.]|nr:hypothetical protein [Zavarzinia sp.]
MNDPNKNVQIEQKAARQSGGMDAQTQTLHLKSVEDHMRRLDIDLRAQRLRLDERIAGLDRNPLLKDQKGETDSAVAAAREAVTREHLAPFEARARAAREQAASTEGRGERYRLLAERADRAERQLTEAKAALSRPASPIYQRLEAAETAARRDVGERRDSLMAERAGLVAQRDRVAQAIEPAQRAVKHAQTLQAAGYTHATVPKAPPALSTPAQARHTSATLGGLVQAMPPARAQAASQALQRSRVASRGDGR